MRPPRRTMSLVATDGTKGVTCFSREAAVEMPVNAVVPVDAAQERVTPLTRGF